MSRYVSRKYLREKWESLKWDMEKTLDIYKKRTESDSIEESDLNRCYYNVMDKIECIKRELEDTEGK